MSWIFFKVISDMLAAGNVVVAKEMLSRYVSDRRLYIFCVALVSIPFALFGLCYFVVLSSSITALIALMVGVSYITSGHFYYLAVSGEEPFRLSLVLRLGSVFTLVLSVVILGEHLQLTQALGFWISFAGGAILTIEWSRGSLRIDKNTLNALLSVLTGAISSILTVYLLRHYNAWQTFSMTRVGVVLGTLVLLRPRGTLNTSQSLRGLRFRYSSVLIGEQLIRLVSLFLQTIAVAQIGSATLVAVLSGFMPLYVWGMASAVGQEKIHGQKVRSRFLALFILLLGSFLMTR